MSFNLIFDLKSSAKEAKRLTLFPLCFDNAIWAVVPDFLSCPIKSTACGWNRKPWLDFDSNFKFLSELNCEHNSQNPRTELEGIEDSVGGCVRFSLELLN